MPQKPKDPCKKNACRIQDCLERNNFQEKFCLNVLEEMRQCCLKWHKESLCCTGIDLNKVYITSKDNINNVQETNSN